MAGRLLLSLSSPSLSSPSLSSPPRPASLLASKLAAAVAARRSDPLFPQTLTLIAARFLDHDDYDDVIRPHITASTAAKLTASRARDDDGDDDVTGGPRLTASTAAVPGRVHRTLIDDGGDEDDVIRPCSTAAKLHDNGDNEDDVIRHRTTAAKLAAFPGQARSQLKQTLNLIDGDDDEDDIIRAGSTAVKLAAEHARSQLKIDGDDGQDDVIRPCSTAAEHGTVPRRTRSQWNQIRIDDSADDDVICQQSLLSTAFVVALGRLHDADAALAFYGWLKTQGFYSPSSRIYSPLIKNLAMNRRFEELEIVLEDMGKEGVQPSIETLGDVAAGYAVAGHVEKSLKMYSLAKEIHNQLIYTHACNLLLKLLFVQGFNDVARQVFDEMLKREITDNFSVGIMVKGFCDMGLVDEAEKLVLGQWGCLPGVIFYNEMINGWFKKGDFRRARKLFREMQFKGFLPSLISYGIMISGLSKIGKFDEIRGLIMEMKERGMKLNLVIYNSLVDAFCRRGSVIDAKSVLKQMIALGPDPDIVTYNAMINGLCRIGRIDQGERMMRLIERRGVKLTALSFTPLIHHYSVKGEVIKASDLLMEMMEKGYPPDLIACGGLIHGLVGSGEIDAAIAIKNRMVIRGVMPDAAVFNVIISGLCKKGLLFKAKGLLSEMLDLGISPDEFVYTTLIDGFVRSGDLDEAKKLFVFLDQKETTHHHGVVVYNAMIKGHARLGQMTEAISCLHGMRKKRIVPDMITFTTLIDGYVRQGDMKSAMSVFSNMRRERCMPNVVTYTALIYGFCRAGDFERARRLFEDMKSYGMNPNVITYSIIIGHACKAGEIDKAVGFFEDMLLSKCSPNDVTFHYLLNGLVSSISGIHDESSLLLGMFKNMVEDGWDPWLAAYNAIIIFLCDHGMVESALGLVKKMKAKGHGMKAVTWLFLLHGFCVEGRPDDWRRMIHYDDFSKQEMESLIKYAYLLDKYTNKGNKSEASKMMLSLLEQVKPEESLNYG